MFLCFKGMKPLKLFELAILIATIALIFYSEYLFTVKNEPNQAIFIGLWPPTMILLLIYFNLKSKK